MPKNARSHRASGALALDAMGQNSGVGAGTRAKVLAALQEGDAPERGPSARFKDFSE